MYTNKTNVRVRYAETDQMGVVYYGVYAQYFEVGRVEAMRELGLSYKEMEERGTMLPVSKLEVNYRKSASYDEELTVLTHIKEMPGVKLTFHHEVLNKNGEVLTTGKVVLVFVNEKTRRPSKPPRYFVEEMQKHLKV